MFSTTTLSPNISNVWTTLASDSNQTDSNSQNSYTVSLLLSCLYTVLLFPLGLVGNVLILLVNFDPCQRMSSPDLYFTNLALADLVLVLDSLIEVFNLSAHYYDNAVLCTCMALFLQVNMYSSVFSLTWMSLDRCLALTQLSTRAMPVNTSVRQRPRLAQRACLAIWAAAVLSTLLPFASAHIHHGWGRGFCFAGAVEVQWVEVTLGFVLPFCVMGVCYALIARALLRASRRGNGSRTAPPARARRGKALRMIVAAVTVFFVCWLPENVFVGVNLLRGVTEGPRRRGNRTLWQRYPLTGHIVTLAACANSCLNPLVYSLLGKTFRRKLRIFIKHHAHCLTSHTHTHSCPNRTTAGGRTHPRDGENERGECERMRGERATEPGEQRLCVCDRSSDYSGSV
ncbi:G-protein coupled estrogen receptor 1-like [Chanos chanos]|uniref:G-protein coupled estrogen receptor 1 n=1 Tax=Chanos chanos TaxID=29144 RepID=A0A6J2UVU6_CHACN|nr:G-protein coupled estrogen receptor 1-like [Chanos chanos]